MTNRVKEFRKLAKFTQQQVGDLVGMSQTNFHRLENGTSPTSAEQEVKIARALGQEVEVVFPAGAHRELLASLGELAPMTRKHADGRWMFRFKVGRYCGFAVVDGKTRVLLADRLEGRDRDGFIVFDSSSARYAVSLSALRLTEMLPAESEGQREEATTPGSLTLKCVHLDDDFATPYEIAPEPNPFKDASPANLLRLFAGLHDDRQPRVAFVSSDSESKTDTAVGLSKASLALIEVPLAAFSAVSEK